MDDAARGIAFLPKVADDLEYRDLRAGGPMDDRLHPRRLRRGRLGEQRLVGGTSERGVKAHHALDPFNSADLLDLLSHVIKIANPLTRQRTAARIAHYHVKEGRSLSGKLLQLVVAPPRLGVGRKHADVTVRNPDLENRRDHDQQ